MDLITKEKLLKKLQLNLDLLMLNLNENSVTNKNTSFYNLLKNKEGENIAEISFHGNGGDIRRIKLFITLKNKKKKTQFMFELEDSSIGCGKYTPIWGNYLGAPLAMQVYSFDNKQTTTLSLDYNKMELIPEANLILKPLTDLFFRTHEELSSYYTSKNIESNLTAFEEYQKKDNLYPSKLLLSDTVAATAIFKSSNYFN